MVFSILDYSKNNYKHYIMPSLCASLKIVIINSIGSSFKLLCNSALLYHYCTIVNHLLICICCITLGLLCPSFNLNDFKVYLYSFLCYTSTFVHDILVIYISFG